MPCGRQVLRHGRWFTRVHIICHHQSAAAHAAAPQAAAIIIIIILVLSLRQTAAAAAATTTTTNAAERKVIGNIVVRVRTYTRGVVHTTVVCTCVPRVDRRKHECTLSNLEALSHQRPLATLVQEEEEQTQSIPCYTTAVVHPVDLAVQYCCQAQVLQ